jgi:NAD-dependent DNA ligase
MSFPRQLTARRFPEVGGGSGLNLGKDKVKGMVEAFGGKVTGSVSGRTHILVVGKEPGLGKVSQAERQPNCQLMVRHRNLILLAACF